MRTTVTLDDDTTNLVRRRMAERGVGFKQALNELIRETAERGREPFRTPIFAMGQPTVDLTKALQLAAQLEDDEIQRKLHRGV
jgi:hypothetical protein